MSVCLTKPTALAPAKIREYTPVHLTDEVYPNNALTKPTVVKEYTPVHLTDEMRTESVDNGIKLTHKELKASLAVFLHDAVITSLDSYNDSEENIGLFREIFNTNGNFDADHLIIDDGEVVYSQYINRLFETGDVIVSALLNSLQEVLVCIEHPRSSFSSLCSCLEHRWTASTNHPYYLELCSFLADVKSGNVTKIMDVLNREPTDFGDNFFGGSRQWNEVIAKFYSTVNTRLFSSLYSLLKREKDIEVHPLFLFVCQNYSVADAEVSDRLRLQAYGKSLEGVLLPEPKVFPKFFENVEDHMLFLTVCSVFFCSSSIASLYFLQRDLGLSFGPWCIPIIALIIFSCLCPFCAYPLNAWESCIDLFNDNMHLYGGLKCFLEAQGAVIKELPNGMNRFLQKYERRLRLA